MAFDAFRPVGQEERMPHHNRAIRCMRGVPANVLGSIVSRYSDYDGYWLFGMVVADLRATKIDLLADMGDVTEPNPRAALFHRAKTVFHQQLVKAGVNIARIREATLDLTRSSTRRPGVVNHHAAEGYDVTLTIRVSSDVNKVYQRTMVIFVSPHDPRVELRSARAAN